MIQTHVHELHELCIYRKIQNPCAENNVQSNSAMLLTTARTHTTDLFSSIIHTFTLLKKLCIEYSVLKVVVIISVHCYSISSEYNDR